MDLGQLDKGIELLHRCLELMPRHSHACVALGITYQKKGDQLRMREYSTCRPWPLIQRTLRRSRSGRYAIFTEEFFVRSYHPER